MKDDNQLIFDFSEESLARPSRRRQTPLEYKRAIIAWLACQNPSGLGLKVATRFAYYYADIAAFWSVPRRKRLYPQKTVIVELRTKREKCWPDCSNKDELLPKLRVLKEDKKELEKAIRKQEPHLRDGDNLFDDFEIWNYDQSCNQDYHACCRTIEETEHALYHGSRFEQIRRAHVADYLYLAVPEGAVHPHELADGWGLLYLGDDHSVQVAKNAEAWDCPEENKLHLIQNIASSNLKNALFSMGVMIDPDSQTPVFTPKPHRRRLPKKK